MSHISIVAFDLDGTVFATPGSMVIRPRVEKALKAAHDAGVLTCVVSGRPAGMLGPQLAAAPWLDWHITVNGAVVGRASSDKPAIQHAMPLDMARDVLDCVAQHKPAWSMFRGALDYWETGGLSYMLGNKDLAEVEDFMGMRDSLEACIACGSVADVLREGDEPVDKFGCSYAKPSDSVAAEKVLRARGDLEVIRMSPQELELTMRGVTKGSALGELCEYLDIDEHEVVCFGDSGNDMPLTGRACTFVAMGNATPDVAAVADDRTDSVTDDGVATWLESHL